MHDSKIRIIVVCNKNRSRNTNTHKNTYHSSNMFFELLVGSQWLSAWGCEDNGLTYRSRSMATEGIPASVMTTLAMPMHASDLPSHVGV